MPVYLLATLDTKGLEAAYLRDLLREFGVDVQVVDVGCLGEPQFRADVPREEIFAAAGTSLARLKEQNDRGAAVSAAAIGVAAFIRKRHEDRTISGIIGMGGSAGTTIATAAMRMLPIGIPKLMISTLASGNVRPYVGDKDVSMLNSIVDISGINRISRAIFQEAAKAMAGMVSLKSSAAQTEHQSDRPLIAATMFGVTTPCVEHARKILEEAGFEVLVFHATGTGGQAMESLAAEGQLAGILDITTTELADELVGGVLSAGPTRLTAAGKRGIPQVISVGATDMVNFGPKDTVPAKFQHRLFYQHNPTVTLMRTTPEECEKLGEEIAQKASAAVGPTAIYIPLKGVSAIDQPGKAFDDPEARSRLYDALRKHHGQTELVELPLHINDPEFAEAMARRLLEMIGAREVSPG
jgi:uncharacterized protein (UPF0261 family)